MLLIIDNKLANHGQPIQFNSINANANVDSQMTRTSTGKSSLGLGGLGAKLLFSVLLITDPRRCSKKNDPSTRPDTSLVREAKGHSQ